MTTPDDHATALAGIYRELCKQGAELADLMKDSTPDEDLCGALRNLAWAMEKLCSSYVLALVDCSDGARSCRLTDKQFDEVLASFAPDLPPRSPKPGDVDDRQEHADFAQDGDEGERL